MQQINSIKKNQFIKKKHEKSKFLKQKKVGVKSTLKMKRRIMLKYYMRREILVNNNQFTKQARIQIQV